MLVCFAAFVFMNCVARPMVEKLEVDWAVLLVDMLVPISVTFVSLYRSCWHPEITGAARTISLLLLSCLILLCVNAAFVILVVICYLAYATVFVGFTQIDY